MTYANEQIKDYLKISLERIEPVDEQEIKDKKSIKNFLVLHPDNFYDRKNFKGHIIASVLVLSERKILLIRDNKTNDWILPAWHCASGEIPYETIEKEIKEKMETENLIPKHLNEENKPLPFYCNIQSVAEEGEECKHKHLNLLYVYEAKNLKIKENFGDTVKIFEEKEAEKNNPAIKKIFLKLAGRVII